MKILLVQPAPFEPGRLGLENIIWLSEPVALTSLAAIVPEHEVRILDMRLEVDLAYNQMLLEFRPDLVGVTSMTTDCYQAKALLEIAKGTLGRQCVTIVGGHHPTLQPESFEDPCVDVMCIGEGEDTFRELVTHLANGGSPNQLDAIAGLRYRDEAMHVSRPSRWLASPLRGWFLRVRRLHDIHHVAIDQHGRFTSNFGVAFHGFDRLFGSYRSKVPRRRP